MKKIAVVVIFIATTAFLFIYFTNRSYTKERVLAKYSLSKKELSLLKDGDIVLRYGYGMVSDLIVKNLKEPYTISHCGIVCKRKDSTIVIHSVSSSVSNFDGLQYQSIKSFIYDSKRNSLIVIRYKKQNPNDSISLISKGAYYYLNKKVPLAIALLVPCKL